MKKTTPKHTSKVNHPCLCYTKNNTKLYICICVCVYGGHTINYESASKFIKFKVETEKQEIHLDN